ncbi:hypothetical protein PHYSODRAFT_337684 [Phytophthora sojae]|uniref:Uncharacterized protein n=1 Tax=Phytophthora sojae (strain P6497) TaxID=1094619 RepID=G5A1W8_PHYSP|nr:hypothetical protein PHYSODRAFT_337684 [Phytophthora sojae]EGZ10916.1 hypothetical protein PHYSODRAFT_337684 [Phytophthora sojae]|eukprot:XP_009533661.1 hypothetical protein PHYSODRAFT_337684 [Phytophthora sojae]
MAAMDRDHQLSDTSRATKEAEPEVWAELRSDFQEAERSYAEFELSLECDDQSPRLGRGAERSRVEFELNLPSGCGAVAQDAEMIDKLGKDRRSERSDVESEPGLECDWSCRSPVEVPGEESLNLSPDSGTDGEVGGTGESRTLQADLNGIQRLQDDARRRGAAALAKTKDIGRIFKGAR